MPSSYEYAPRPSRWDGHPMRPAGGAKWYPASKPRVEGMAVVYVGLQVDSPYEARTETEVGQRGRGAHRAFVATAPIPGWDLGSEHVVHHYQRGSWEGTWRIDAVVTWTGDHTHVDGALPERDMPIWYLLGGGDKAIARYEAGPQGNLEDVRPDGQAQTRSRAEASAAGQQVAADVRAAEYSEGSGVGDWVLYQSQDGRVMPALVTITPGSYDPGLTGNVPPLEPGCRSLIVFRPSGSSYARHAVTRFTDETPPRTRSWRLRG